MRWVGTNCTRQAHETGRVQVASDLTTSYLFSIFHNCVRMKALCKTAHGKYLLTSNRAGTAPVGVLEGASHLKTRSTAIFVLVWFRDLRIALNANPSELQWIAGYGRV